MLRISVELHGKALSLTLEGRLVGPWVDELLRVKREHESNVEHLTIDLCGLTTMDARGQVLLEEFLRGGATMRCSDVLNQYLIEQMARRAGGATEACRPCRFPSEADWPAAEDGLFRRSKAS